MWSHLQHLRYAENSRQPNPPGMLDDVVMIWRELNLIFVKIETEIADDRHNGGEDESDSLDGEKDT